MQNNRYWFNKNLPHKTTLHSAICQFNSLPLLSSFFESMQTAANEKDHFRIVNRAFYHFILPIKATLLDSKFYHVNETPTFPDLSLPTTTSFDSTAPALGTVSQNPWHWMWFLLADGSTTTTTVFLAFHFLHAFQSHLTSISLLRSAQHSSGVANSVLPSN